MHLTDSTAPADHELLLHSHGMTVRIAVTNLATESSTCVCADAVLGGDHQRLDVRIKWPNDLYAGPHKLGGILCQTVYRDRQFQVRPHVALALLNRLPRQHSPSI